MPWPRHRIDFIVGLLFVASLMYRPLAFSQPQIQANRPNRSSAAGVLKQRFESAMAAYKAGHYQEALLDLQPLLATRSDNADVNELAGLIHAATGRQDEAYPYLARAVRLNPAIPSWRTALAVNLVKLHRNTDAERQFRKAAELEPQNYAAHHNLGEFYIQTGKVNQAIPYLKRAQELNASDYNNGYDLALAYEQSGNLDGARRALLALIKLDDKAELHSLLGEVEEKSKDYVAAVSAYEKAARMDPSENNIFAWSAELLLHQTFEPAAAVAKAGLERFAGSARLQLALAIALYGEGHFDEGVREFCNVWDKNPADPLPLSFAGKVYENVSAPVADQVRARFVRFLESGGRDASINYYYSLSLWKAYQQDPHAVPLEQVESLLKTAISLQPDYADAHLQLGIVYTEQRRYAEAAAQYEQGLKITPSVSAIHYRLGQALARMGNKARAQEEFAAFERLHSQEIAETERQQAEIRQFVYTMRSREEGNPKGSN